MYLYMLNSQLILHIIILHFSSTFKFSQALNKESSKFDQQTISYDLPSTGLDRTTLKSLVTRVPNSFSSATPRLAMVRARGASLPKLLR